MSFLFKNGVKALLQLEVTFEKAWQKWQKNVVCLWANGPNNNCILLCMFVEVCSTFVWKIWCCFCHCFFPLLNKAYLNVILCVVYCDNYLSLWWVEFEVDLISVAENHEGAWHCRKALGRCKGFNIFINLGFTKIKASL